MTVDIKAKFRRAHHRFPLFAESDDGAMVVEYNHSPSRVEPSSAPNHACFGPLYLLQFRYSFFVFQEIIAFLHAQK